MKTRNALLVTAAAGALLLLAGCGGSGTMATPVAVAPAIEAATTTEVLVIARAPSESAEPLRVGSTAITLAAQSDENSDPLPVGG